VDGRSRIILTYALETTSTITTSQIPWRPIRTGFYIVGALVLFIFALDLMTTSVHELGATTVQTILKATSNPFAALFIGMLMTALMQSSSTTTAIALALVVSGSLTFESCVPIIMGANIGTTITSLIVSLGFVNKKKEFKRAISAGSYHFFFNALTVIILFPLEYHYESLSSVSRTISNFFFTTTEVSDSTPATTFYSPLEWLSRQVAELVANEILLIALSFTLLFGSILLFRKLISDLLKANSPEKFSRFFFVNGFKSFLWGFLTTAAIRSSTITTSVVVPIVAKKIITLQRAAPFIMGANIGTTITIFIAALLSVDVRQGMNLAMAHILFNGIGVLLFFPIPFLKNVPIALANGLGNLTQRNRFIGFAFILVMFFILPFALIFFNQDKF
jgi:solute carrier family 34 (sodium-dependent phosphate cotransporter)